MQLQNLLLTLPALVAFTSALPTTAPVDESILPIDANAEVIDISSWTPSSPVPGVSSRDSDPSAAAVVARELRILYCGTGKPGNYVKFHQWFSEAHHEGREICLADGERKVWQDGNNRFVAANRSGAVRCNRYYTYAVHAIQLDGCRRPGAVCEKPSSCWGPDHVFEKQTFSLYSI